MSYLTQFAILTPKASSFITHIANSGKAKQKSTSLAVARVLASSIALPTEDVSSDVSYYWRNNCHIPVSCKFDALNEMVIHDRAEVMRYAQAFYAHRVCTAYMRPTTYGESGSENQFLNFFGFTQYFDVDTLKHIQNNEDDLTVLCDGYASVFVALDKPQ